MHKGSTLNAVMLQMLQQNCLETGVSSQQLYNAVHETPVVDIWQCRMMISLLLHTDGHYTRSIGFVTLHHMLHSKPCKYRQTMYT